LEHVELMQAKGTISAEDMRHTLSTDSIDEAVEYIRQNSIYKFKLQTEKPKRPFKWLFEER
jgi:hypothetical protein